jgi:Kazal-type serine protease inhibitor-like protein
MIRKCSCSPLSTALLAIALLLGGALALEAQTGATCGGIGALKCPENQACQFPAGMCNAPDLAGTCVAVPKNCPKEGPRICGCDGVTYPNECELLKAGVREAKKGACGATEQRKTCKSNADCTQPNNFCEFKTGTCGTTGSGRCTLEPQICPQIFDPVCGCDDKTYPNDCIRRGAGVSLKSTGECPKKP